MANNSRPMNLISESQTEATFLTTRQYASSNLSLQETLSHTTINLWPAIASDYIDWIFPPVALLIANICNVLGILVLSRPTLRSTSIGIYLLILAVADIIYLNSFLLVSYVEHISDYTFNLACWLKCKLHLTLLNLFSHLASWILVAVTIDRLIAISIPLHAHLYCTPKRSLKVCLVLFSIFLVIDGKELFTVTGRFFIPGTNQYIFTFINNSYASFWTRYGIWILTLLNHVTFPIILILNMFLIYFLLKIVKIRKEMTEKDISDKSIRAKIGGNNVSKHKVKSSEIKFTKVLLFVSTSSILMNIPFAYLVLMLLGGFWKNEEHTLYENVLIWFLYKFFFAVATTHRASYFFMYCLTGEKFRNELKKMFSPQNRGTNATSGRFASQTNVTEISNVPPREN